MHTHVDNYKINQGDGIGLNGETNVQRGMYNTYQNSKDYFVKETITYRDNKISQSVYNLHVPDPKHIIKRDILEGQLVVQNYSISIQNFSFKSIFF